MEFLFAAILAAGLQQPARSSEPPKGRRIEAKDGDLIVSPLGAKLRLAQHAEGQVRVIYNEAQRWVIVLVDHTGTSGTPDGAVDASYYFRDIAAWPLGERWEGRAAVDEYSLAGEALVGLGLPTPGAFVQLFTNLGPPRGIEGFNDPSATAVVPFSGFGRGAGARLGFDAEEQRQTVNVTRPLPPGRATPPAATFIDRVRTDTGAAAAPTPTAPVRVGSRIIQPTKIVDVKPVMPPEAVQAGIRGVVILEVTLGVDGRVTDAKVLRSIPVLDQAALDAVRQWRYEPTLLDGRPVPIIVTVTVPFQ
jgi:TonB family protein